MQVPQPLEPEGHTAWELVVQFGLRSVVLSAYGEEEYVPSSAGDSETGLCGLAYIDNEQQNEASNVDCRVPGFQYIQALLKGRLESEYRKLEREKDATRNALLRKFVESWRRFTEVITWLQQTSPIYFTISGKGGNGKSLKHSVIELYTGLVLNKIGAAVRDATFRIIQSEKDGAEIDTSLTKSVSLVIFETQNMNQSMYEKMWQEPVLQLFSRLYLQDTGSWFAEEGLKRFDSAITQASECIVNYCPNKHLSKQAQTTFTGLARVQNYLKLQEVVAGRHFEVSSILGGMDEDEIQNMYDVCHDLKHLRLVAPLVLRYQTEKYRRQLTLEHLGTLNSFDLARIPILVDNMDQASDCINAYRPSVVPEGPERHHFRYTPLIECKTMLQRLGHTMKIQVAQLLATEDSQLRAILRRNDEDEILAMYQLCYNLEGFQNYVPEEILDYEIRQVVNSCWEILKRTAGHWFESDSLARVNSKLTEICEFVDTRLIMRSDEEREKQHKRIADVFRPFVTENQLTRMFEDKTSPLSNAFRRMDLQEMDRIYLLCSPLTHLQYVKIHILRFELELCTKRVLALFEKGRWKWFTEENYMDKFDKEIVRNDTRISNRQHFSNEERNEVRGWVHRLNVYLFREVKESSADENSEISAIFRRNDPAEIRRMYHQCGNTAKLPAVATNIYSDQQKKYRRSIRDCITAGRGKWFADGWIIKIDFEITQACTKSNYYWDLLLGDPETVEDCKRELMKLFNYEVEVPRMLEDKDSEISGIFRRNDEKEIIRMYQTCFSLDTFHELGTFLLRFELRNLSKYMTNVTKESLSRRLFTENCFSQIASEISKAYAFIRLRCGGNVERSETEEQKFATDLDNEIVRWMSTNMESIVSVLKNKRLKDRERLCKRVGTLGRLPAVGTTLLGSLLKIEGEQVLTKFHKARGADLPQGPPKQEYPFTFVVVPLKPLLGVTVSLSEVEEFFLLLFKLRSKYKGMAVGYFEESEKVDSLLSEALSEIINLETGNGESTITELLAGFVHLCMRNVEEGDVEARIQLTVQLLSLSATRERFRLLSEQYLAKRLVSVWDVGEPGSAKYELNLVNRLSLSFGLVFVERMLEMITDFVKAQAIQQDAALSTSGSEIETTGSITLPQRSVKVLRNDLWAVNTEVQIKLPPPLEEALTQFEKCFGEVEGQKELEYVHSLGKVAFETKLFANKGNKKTKLVGSIHQASILLLFNSQKRITFAEMLDALQKKGSDHEESYKRKTKALLSAALKSLLSSECPILLKNPKAEQLRRSDVLQINRRFTTPEKELQLPSAQTNPSEEDTEEDDLIKSLPLTKAIDVAIMKVMKENRELKLDKLFEKVVKYSKNRVPLSLFEFEIKDFLLQVEKLVDIGSLDSNGESNPTITF